MTRIWRGFVPASTMHASHTIGSVPVCRVTASTMQETHTKGSVPVCRVYDKNLEKSVRKGTQFISHAMAFDELSGAEEDGREEANVHREQKEKTESYKQESELLCNFHTRWVEVLERECASCEEERSRRKRVLDDTETSLSADFALAPLITAMNKPRYLASQQRARLFAEFHRTQVLWIQAEDFPLSGEIATYTEEKLNQRRQDFLRRHDQSTGGIMGLFPMVCNLPVTFTATVDKKRKIFKFTHGHIVGWTLDVADEQRVRETMDFEIVLERQPAVIFVCRDGEGMPQHEDLEPECML